MKNILLLIKMPPPVHGGTIMNQLVYDSKLLRKNFNIRSITVNYVESVKELKIFTIKKFYKSIQVFFALLREIIIHRPHLLYFPISHLGTAFMRDLFFVIVIKIFKIKIVYHLHGRGIFEATKNNLLKRFLYKYVFYNTTVICLSELLKYDLEFVFEGKIYILNNGIPAYNHSIEKKNTHDFVTILFLSNLIKTKGILDYIDALELIYLNNIIFHAKIVGAESSFTVSKINHILNEKNLSNHVEYLGPLYGENKIYELVNSDIFVFPTYYEYECFPLVILEAMQFGIPVISTKVGAIPEIIEDGKTGFLVDMQNPIQLADKLEILINDEERRLRLGNNGKEKFQNQYTVNIFEKKLSNIFQQILSTENSQITRGGNDKKNN